MIHPKHPNEMIRKFSIDEMHKSTKSKHTLRCTMSRRIVWHPWPNTSAPGAPTRHTPKSISCETKEIFDVTNIFVQGAPTQHTPKSISYN